MKSGTTWLYRQLEQHPDICFSPEKEIHYLADAAGCTQNLRFAYRLSRFNAARHRAANAPQSLGFERTRWYLDYLFMPRTWEWYVRRFGRVRDGAYCADFSNLTALLSTDDWAQLLSRVDDIRVLYVLRDPLDRIWSQLKSHYQSGGDQRKALTLETYQQQGEIRDEDLVRHSLYARHLQALLASVEPGKIQLLSYEQIQSDPEGLLRTLETFLGLPHHHYLPEKLHRKINASTNEGRPPWIKEHFYPLIAQDLQALRTMNLGFSEQWCS